MRLRTTWFGTFLLEGGRIVEERLFPKDPEALSRILEELEEGRVLPEERELGERREFFVEEERLLSLPGAHLERTSEGSVFIPRPQDYGYTYTLLHDSALLLEERKLSCALSSRSLQVIQAIDALEEVLESTNLLSERLREWYGIHSPEVVRLLEDHEELAQAVSESASREEILARWKGMEGSRSLGGEIREADREILQKVARRVRDLHMLRRELEEYLGRTMREVAPNVTTLVGPLVGARLLRSAGGIERLAELPAGTIQTLGAEKALFRHLLEGTKPPKHGHIFQVPLIHRAPKSKRGALARALSSRIALAARADAITQDPTLGERLRGELEKKEREVLARRRSRPPKDRRRKGRGPR